MKFLLMFVGLIITSQANAQVYSCANDHGGKTYQQTPCAGSTGSYVRCIKENGDSYIYRGSSCPVRHVPVPQKAGMVTDVTTGQQIFMIPGGGNGMIDPTTGQRHELIGAPPTRLIEYRAEPISQESACQQARIKRDYALSNPNRTINSIRAAEAKYAKLGCN